MKGKGTSWNLKSGDGDFINGALFWGRSERDRGKREARERGGGGMKRGDGERERCRGGGERHGKKEKVDREREACT